jgi:hypothetical protein
MIDPTLEIRAHYLNLIGDISIPVGNVFVSTQSPPFVVVTTRAAYTGTKNSWEWVVTTMFDIVMKTDGDWGGDQMAETVANEIVHRLLSTRPNYPGTLNFQIVTANIEASDPFLEQTQTGKVIRKILQLENYISLRNPEPSGLECTLDGVLDSVLC